MSASGGQGPGQGHASRLLSSVSTTVRAVQYEHLVAGMSGGVVSTLVLHPLDLLKIREGERISVELGYYTKDGSYDFEGYEDLF